MGMGTLGVSLVLIYKRNNSRPLWTATIMLFSDSYIANLTVFVPIEIRYTLPDDNGI